MDLALPQELLFEILKFLEYTELVNLVPRYPFINGDSFWIFKLNQEYPNFNRNALIQGKFRRCMHLIVLNMLNIDLTNYSYYRDLNGKGQYIVFKLTTFKNFFLIPDITMKIAYCPIQSIPDRQVPRGRSLISISREELTLIVAHLNIRIPVRSVGYVRMALLCKFITFPISDDELTYAAVLLENIQVSKQDMINEIVHKLSLGTL